LRLGRRCLVGGALGLGICTLGSFRALFALSSLGSCGFFLVGRFLLDTGGGFHRLELFLRDRSGDRDDGAVGVVRDLPLVARWKVRNPHAVADVEM
jgi:hypothetical protein